MSTFLLLHIFQIFGVSCIVVNSSSLAAPPGHQSCRFPRHRRIVVRWVAKLRVVSCRIYCLGRKVFAPAFMPYSLCGAFIFWFFPFFFWSVLSFALRIELLCRFCPGPLCKLFCLRVVVARTFLFPLYAGYAKRRIRKFVANYGTKLKISARSRTNRAEWFFPWSALKKFVIKLFAPMDCFYVFILAFPAPLGVGPFCMRLFVGFNLVVGRGVEKVP